ncbi:TlpA family protein disulfide reductase [Lysobacter pythonis]|uniref:TlpA family protein disulfide reductase n=1 Tax=Solilutibacter pythonis TaxID=2483112 RepID=A0A3M2HYH9_9GAMM|nr:TlpA disulfide reductase family protein [Lysobacter pythonis]RMH92893.1 TlpA family protein disulfide reductase [Lysobacter pythonis]
MKREAKQLLLIASAAALAGAVAAFVIHGPGPIWRTELGQRALNAAIQPEAPAGQAIARRGERLPPVPVRTLAGELAPLPLPPNRPALINLWATWCGPCVREMPELAAFAGAQGADGVQVIGVALDDAEAVRQWLHRQPSPYPHYRDDAGPRDAGVVLGNPAGVLPYSVLLDADGRVLKQRVGPFDSAREISAWSSEVKM